jgi:hypothetical protein
VQAGEGLSLRSHGRETGLEQRAAGLRDHRISFIDYFHSLAIFTHYFQTTQCTHCLFALQGLPGGVHAYFLPENASAVKFPL